MFDFTGQVIAITGASSGIGLEIARKFYLAGARLALCSRSEERVRSAVADWANTSDARLLIISADTSIIKDIYRFRDAAVERFGRIDVWVNNAGIEHPMPTVEMTQEIFDAVVNTNFRGYYFGCQSAAQDMLRRLFECYVSDPDRLPPEFQDIREREGVERAVCDYIAGMTDKYAVEKFSEAFIPMSWGVK